MKKGIHHQGGLPRSDGNDRSIVGMETRNVKHGELSSLEWGKNKQNVDARK
jgi:hypothetical protein